MANPVKHGKFVEPIAFENAFQIELKIGWPRRTRRVTKDSQTEAVRDNPPQHLLPFVEKVLQHRLRTGTQLGMEAAIEIDLQSLDVDRNRIFPLAATVGNGVCRIIHDHGGRLELQIKPQHIDIAEKRNYPTSGNRSAIRITVPK